MVLPYPPVENRTMGGKAAWNGSGRPPVYLDENALDADNF